MTLLMTWKSPDYFSQTNDVLTQQLPFSIARDSILCQRTLLRPKSGALRSFCRSSLRSIYACSPQCSLPFFQHDLVIQSKTNFVYSIPTLTHNGTAWPEEPSCTLHCAGPAKSRKTIR